MNRKGESRPATRLVHAGRNPAAQQGAVNPPVYRATTILKPSLAEWEASLEPGYEGYRYGLLGTPTSDAFEAAMAELYGADGAVAVSSGLAMITVALTALTKAGDHILVPDTVYEPGRRFCDRVLARFGVETTYYDPLIGAGIAALMRPETSLVYTESPGSLTFEMQDVPAIVAAAHAGGARVVIDNTWATGLYHNPFLHGVDVVLEATTKYVGGHADLLMGVILGNRETLPRLVATAKMLGNCCGADDLYLAQRGLRSLAVRIGHSEASALELARWLATRPEVKRVLHPALPGDPGHAIWRRDFGGASGLFAMLLHKVPRPALAAMLDGLEFFGIGVSWGGYESLILPVDPMPLRTATRWTDEGTLVRIYAGLEDPRDLAADLASGFERLAAARCS
jgi:cystathionine beta-lyase